MLGLSEFIGLDRPGKIDFGAIELDLLRRPDGDLLPVPLD